MNSNCSTPLSPDLPEDLAAALAPWFAVEGDIDDFIYYDDAPKEHSDR